MDMAVQCWSLAICIMGYYGVSPTTQYTDVNLDSQGWSLDGCKYMPKNISITCQEKYAELRSPEIRGGKCVEIRLHSYVKPYVFLYIIPFGTKTRTVIKGKREFKIAGDSVIKANIEIDRPYLILISIINSPWRGVYHTEIKSFRVENSAWYCQSVQADWPCKSDPFYCSAGQCVRNADRCDGKSDCLNGRDEENCSDSNSGFNYHYLAIIIPIAILMACICCCCCRNICSETGTDSGIDLIGVTHLEDQADQLDLYTRTSGEGDNPSFTHSDNLPPSYGECTAGSMQMENGVTPVEQPGHPQGSVVGVMVGDRGPGIGQDGDHPMPPDYDQVISGGFIELDPSQNPELPEEHPLQVHRLDSTHL